MSKLLHKPLKQFSLYALLVLLCSIPVYYFTIDRIWSSELDEHNSLVAEHARHELQSLTLNKEDLRKFLLLWNVIKPGTSITAYQGKGVFADSTYTLVRENRYPTNEKIDRFRCLKTLVFFQKEPYILTVETNIEETQETVVAIAVTTLVFFLILIIGFLFLNRRVASKIWSPFQETLTKLQSFDLNSQKPIYFNKSDIEEFETLNKVLQQLIDRNLSAFLTQKKFTENASHELQTPLAIMQSKLDLLLQEGDLSSKQHQLIRELNTAISRTSRINKSLLMLAKIDNKQFENTDKVQISTLLGELVDLLSEHIAIKEIMLEASICEDISVIGNKVLVEVLLQNLLFNAYRHNEPGGKILIRLNSQKLVIANSGKESLQMEGLFKRFSQTDGAGTGLGLAIIKEICAAFQWPLNYTFENQKHYFSVSFR